MVKKINKKNYSNEAHAGYNFKTAMEEAARCLLCEDAPCSKACPAGTDPGKFIRSLRFKNIKGAAETIREHNILGACCARVCPYDRLCEDACCRTGIDKPIHIGKLQRFALEQEKSFAMKTLKAPAKTKGMIACIGAGPASLACATKLALEGYQVTVFEAMEKAGGVLSYGIVPSRLPQHVVDYEIKLIKNLGVKFVFNTKVGKDIQLNDLKEMGFKAFFIGIGLGDSKKTEIKGSDLQGVHNAITYLKSARNKDTDFNPGREVIIIGGGDVAMDCAITAKLLSADNVNIVYRRSLEEAPVSHNELRYVQSLGISIITKFKPLEIIGEKEVLAVLFAGSDGVSSLKIKADTVVFAIGQRAGEISEIAPVKLTKEGTISCDSDNGITSIKGIFAAGDIVNGGKTVVEAVSQGRKAADSIIKYLTEKNEGK